MRSSAGVGITPPKVDGAEKPTSSVMISSTFGAPLGGTVIDGQYGLESTALGLISPRNGCGGGGKYLPSMVVVAPGEPGVPVICWALTGTTARIPATMKARSVAHTIFVIRRSSCAHILPFPSLMSEPSWPRGCGVSDRQRHLATRTAAPRRAAHTSESSRPGGSLCGAWGSHGGVPPDRCGAAVRPPPDALTPRLFVLARRSAHGP